MLTSTDKHQEILQAAEHLYALRPDWATFYREILGQYGLSRRLFPTIESLSEFEQSDAYAEIHRLLTNLRKPSSGAALPEEPTRVITVRLPKSLHDALRSEAYQHQTSMNKLCISKLLQFINDTMVPSDT